jgi:hypothetical protein
MIVAQKVRGPIPISGDFWANVTYVESPRSGWEDEELYRMIHPVVHHHTSCQMKNREFTGLRKNDVMLMEDTEELLRFCSLECGRGPRPEVKAGDRTT